MEFRAIRYRIDDVKNMYESMSKFVHEQSERNHQMFETVGKAILWLHTMIERLQPKTKGNMKKKAPPKKGKVEKVMHEFKKGKLHSGSKKGPEVKSRKQAVAIALSEARKASEKIPKKKE